MIQDTDDRKSIRWDLNLTMFSSPAIVNGGSSVINESIKFSKCNDFW